jgi:ketosteroid isomerase-like protein
MIDDTDRKDAAEAMSRINQVWLQGDIADLEPLIHPDIVMAFPGFAGSVRGRTELIAGFQDFRNSAVIADFRDDDRQVDVAGNTAVISSRYEMLYERSGERFRATGRDLWVFQKQSDAWIAVWRTMLDVDEQPA